jgi:hypothetical protein
MIPPALFGVTVLPQILTLAIDCQNASEPMLGVAGSVS